MKQKALILSIALVGCSAMNAAVTLQQAKKYYNDGLFERALPTFADLAKKNPGNASYNQWYGACLYETGHKEEAKKYLETAYAKNVTDAARYLAQYALEEMDYEKMADYTDVFAERLGGKESTLSETAEKGYNKLKRVNEMLNSVEKIQIFDSINVDKSEFLKYYKLSKETGTLNTADALPQSLRCNTPEVFIPQSGTRMLWSMEDSVGVNRLAETYRLGDGQWDHATLLPAELNEEGDAAYPFVMTDGTTIYFASNGEGSIGGYDIFMSRKDFSANEYLNPQNIGLPYNSPYDDYMYVIDEMTGIGWWASDRNRIDGKVTIYMFKRNDVRENYDSDDDNIYNLAAVHSIKDTWADDADYSSLKADLEELGNETEKPAEEFSFYIANGVRYTRYDQFLSNEAKSLMEKREQMAEQLSDNKAKLKELRTSYTKAGSTSRQKLASTILQLESTVDKGATELARIDNRIRSTEQCAIDK